MDSDNDEKISPKDLKAYLKRFDYAPSKEEVKELVWQGDEDHDGFLAWDEFERAFQRCIHDKAGKEPRELHNVVLFALNLVEGAVKLSLDAASRLTYLEHGRVSALGHQTFLHL